MAIVLILGGALLLFCLFLIFDQISPTSVWKGVLIIAIEFVAAWASVAMLVSRRSPDAGPIVIATIVFATIIMAFFFYYPSQVAFESSKSLNRFLNTCLVVATYLLLFGLVTAIGAI